MSLSKQEEEKPKSIIDFLLGQDEFNGCWFGDKNEFEVGNFWWRKHLRDFVAEKDKQLSEAKETVKELAGKFVKYHNAYTDSNEENARLTELLKAAEEVIGDCLASHEQHGTMYSELEIRAEELYNALKAKE